MERYTELKNSVQALRSEVRRGVSCSQQARNADKIGLPFSVDTRASKESAAIKLLELQLNTLDKERQEELATTQRKVTDKLKQLEVLRSKFERQIKKLEDGYYSVKDAVRRFESYTCERLSLAEQDFLGLEAELGSKYRDLEAERSKNERELVTKYECKLDYLTEKHGEETASRKDLEEKLKKMAKENDLLHDRISSLEQEHKCKHEELKNKHRQQEKHWIINMQKAAEKHEQELKSMRKAMEKEKSEHEAEKSRLATEFRDYKNDKVNEINCLEQHIKGVLNIKDGKILQLSNELQKLQQLLHELKNF